MDPDATSIGSVALGFGFGARLSLFENAGPLPGVSVSLMRRSVPRVQYGDLALGDDYSFAADVQAWNLRAVAGTRFSVLTLAVGRRTRLVRRRGEHPLPRADHRPSSCRSTSISRPHAPWRFANLGLDFRFVRIVGEAGYQFGKDQDIGTVFQDFDPASGRFFAAAGLQFGL